MFECTLSQLKFLQLICLVFIFIGLIFSICPNLNSDIGTVLLLIFPFVLGIFFNEFIMKKHAIDELCENILEKWNYASKMEYLANNPDNFKEKNIRNREKFLKTFAVRKEVSIYYILVIYLNNVKWFEHNLFCLPADYKITIKQFLEESLEVNRFLLDYNQYDFEHISHYDWTRFKPKFTESKVENFLNFIKKDCDKKFIEKFDEIILICKKFEKDNLY